MKLGHLFPTGATKIRQSRLLLPVLLVGSSVLFSADSKPATMAKGPIPKGSCAVCGMRVAGFPDWAAVITFGDGAQVWFDGPKDVFTYLLDLKRYAPKRKSSEIAAIQVKDYYGLKHIDGRKAFYVIGSEVMGPMGSELVPFATEAGAREFLKDHRGKNILSFQDISAHTLKGLE